MLAPQSPMSKINVPALPTWWHPKGSTMFNQMHKKWKRKVQLIYIYIYKLTMECEITLIECLNINHRCFWGSGT